MELAGCAVEGKMLETEVGVVPAGLVNTMIV